jgi:hypothetical protein
MCLPCFPWTWTKFEDPLDQLHKTPEQSIWVHDRQGWELQKVVSLGFLFLNLLFHFISITSCKSPRSLEGIGNLDMDACIRTCICQ